MYKMVCIFSAIIIMAGIFPVAPVTAGAEGNDAYADIIMEYKQVVRDANNKWITDDYDVYDRLFDWEPLSRVDASILRNEESLTECFGYAYRDINDDQRPELLLLTEDALVLAVFTPANSGTLTFFGMSAYGDGPAGHLCFMLPDNSLAVYRIDEDNGSIQESRLNGAGDTLVRTKGIGWEMSDRDERVRYSIGGDGAKTRLSAEEFENFDTQWEWYYHNRLTRGDLAFIPLFSPDEIAEMSAVPAPDARFEEKATLVNDLTVNIRSGPGTKYAQIGEAYPGASFYHTGITKNGFLQIVYPNINLIRVLAYVNEDLAEVSRVAAEDAVYSSVA
ncbi:MAG: SH3 domain-containing protein, partial [Clostridia bacterium]|nr:SH3 domain-containing protein [Clostridia bacterium]